MKPKPRSEISFLMVPVAMVWWTLQIEKLLSCGLSDLSRRNRREENRRAARNAPTWRAGRVAHPVERVAGAQLASASSAWLLRAGGGPETTSYPVVLCSTSTSFGAT